MKTITYTLEIMPFPEGTAAYTAQQDLGMTPRQTPCGLTDQAVNQIMESAKKMCAAKGLYLQEVSPNMECPAVKIVVVMYKAAWFEKLRPILWGDITNEDDFVNESSLAVLEINATSAVLFLSPSHGFDWLCNVTNPFATPYAKREPRMNTHRDRMNTDDWFLHKMAEVVAVQMLDISGKPVPIKELYCGDLDVYDDDLTE